ncbi:hypothetical protein L209DRAFT_443805 [Thermothelomyces heterothallicus CBS 203.75]
MPTPQVRLNCMQASATAERSTQILTQNLIDTYRLACPTAALHALRVRSNRVPPRPVCSAPILRSPHERTFPADARNRVKVRQAVSAPTAQSLSTGDTPRENARGVSRCVSKVPVGHNFPSTQLPQRKVLVPGTDSPPLRNPEDTSVRNQWRRSPDSLAWQHLLFPWLLEAGQFRHAARERVTASFSRTGSSRRTQPIERKFRRRMQNARIFSPKEDLEGNAVIGRAKGRGRVMAESRPSDGGKWLFEGWRGYL